MAGELFVIGISWRTAPVGVREKLAYPDNEIAGALEELLSSPSIDEAMILSTCNRVEIYGAADRNTPEPMLEAATAEARSFLARSRQVPVESISGKLYEQGEVEAARHAFRVAAALDSMVVGESQILGQLKDAYGVAVRQGATGPLLGRCMERAFSVAKRVRHETGISRGAANVSSVAVELARRVFGELNGKRVLLIGAGKMSALAARHLVAAGASAIHVANRSPDKAEELAREVEGEARSWEELGHLLAGADVIISSTGSKEPILTRKRMKSAMKARRWRPQIVVDIAVPRDAEEKVGDIDGVYLFDIDDLQRVRAENIKEREKEAKAAEHIVTAEVAQFEKWMRSQKVVPTIRSLREHFLAVAGAEAEKVVKALSDDHTPEQREKMIRRMGELIVNKLLHTPMTTLKAGDDPELDKLVKATHRLFDLPDGSGESADSAEAPKNEPARAHASKAQTAEAQAPKSNRPAQKKETAS